MEHPVLPFCLAPEVHWKKLLPKPSSGWGGVWEEKESCSPQDRGGLELTDFPLCGASSMCKGAHTYKNKRMLCLNMIQKVVRIFSLLVWLPKAVPKASNIWTHPRNLKCHVWAVKFWTCLVPETSWNMNLKMLSLICLCFSLCVYNGMKHTFRMDSEQLNSTAA